MTQKSGSSSNALLEAVPTWLIGVFFLGLGGVVLWRPDWFGWLTLEQQRSISDAFLVAGLLTLLVDPFIKARLYKEVSAGTFHYLLGFSQPPEIQDQLRMLAFETKVYARDLRMHLEIKPRDAELTSVEIRSSVRIENPTSQNTTYSPQLAFEDQERPSVQHISVTSDEGTRRFPDNVKPDPMLPGVLTQETDLFILGPGESILVEYHYSVVLPADFFYVHSFGTRTIGFFISTDAPGFEVSTDSEKKDSPWEFRRLFMIGDHVTVRWRRTASISKPAE